MAGSQAATSAGALRQDIGSLPRNEWIKDGQQQDATDFLRALIKALDDEMGCEDYRNSVNHVPSCVMLLEVLKERKPMKLGLLIQKMVPVIFVDTE